MSDYGIDGKGMIFLAVLLMAFGGCIVKGCDYACSKVTVKIERVKGGAP